ncbi:helix-turn-helix domain-containing protein [uncultured Tateyamaria sp.]|uniref:helix-turn-helix transcriptional regulator n=1 Tax=uncultured Tateyamaria sp. TaxID=455651 RepID=UPI0026049E00|nr:helix-turn-helix domain-containing protein [uncultured Tateyamaria sp.]
MHIRYNLRLLTVEQVAEIFGRDRTTIDRWCRERKGFPQKVQLRPVGSRFVAEEIEGYIQKSIDDRDAGTL